MKMSLTAEAGIQLSKVGDFPWNFFGRTDVVGHFVYLKVILCHVILLEEVRTIQKVSPGSNDIQKVSPVIRLLALLESYNQLMIKFS